MDQVDQDELAETFSRTGILAEIEKPADRVACAKTIHQHITAYVELRNDENIEEPQWAQLASSLIFEFDFRSGELFWWEVRDIWFELDAAEEKIIQDALELWERELEGWSDEAKEEMVVAVFGSESGSDSDKTIKA